jgi:hypothetical protein
VKSLNEQVSRIKKMMGINESEIDLNNYKEETPILEDIKLIGTSDEGNPLVSMVINTYIPNVAGDYNSGQSAKIKVVTEWNVRQKSHYRVMRTHFSIKKCLDVTSDVNLRNEVISGIKFIFREHTKLEDLLNTIYQPYFLKFRHDREYGEKIIDNLKKDKNTLENLLSLDSPSQEDAPQDNSTTDNDVSNNNNNNTWASE